MVDVLIKGGTIIDGTGSISFKGAVAIEGDRVKILVGDTSSVPAARVIDAAGYIVTPGFIDVHTHSGLIALSEPLNEAKIRQGVTTEGVGVDGLGYAPMSKKNMEMMLVRNAGLDGYPELDYDWASIPEYLQRFYHKTSGNIFYLVPNSCLRVETVGWGMSSATKDEIRKMQDMVRQGMAEGAVGLSTGLQYPPGSYATTDELVELCKTVAEYGGVYVTHVRYELGDGVFDGFREAAEIGERSGCPVHISHYFATYDLRGQTDKMLQFIDDTRAKGIDITFDTYPWEAGSTMLDIECPQWAHDGGPYELLKRLQNKNDRDSMRGQQPAINGKIGGMIVSAITTEKNKWCEGLTVEQVANKLDKDPWDTICDLIIEENMGVGFYTFSGDMNDVKALIVHPAHMFLSDGLRIGGMPNPRTYATYPKILGQLVRDEKVMPMEQAIRKMTSFPAQRFGLADRGILRDDMKADIVVFDPSTVKGLATFANPKQFPRGIEYVIVNGKLVVDKGEHTGALPGEPLKMRAPAGI